MKKKCPFFCDFPTIINDNKCFLGCVSSVCDIGRDKWFYNKHRERWYPDGRDCYKINAVRKEICPRCKTMQEGWI